jgi:carboxymethylenebutenolidase
MKTHLTAAWILLATITPAFAAETVLPPGEKEAKARLDKSPRHGEWVEIAVAGSQTPLKSYIVYPEVKEKAPVVIVIHEIFGETDWIRAVADQLAADGFIAIVPDLLSGHGAKGGGTDSFAGRDDVTKAIRGLSKDEVTAGLNAVRAYGMKLPAASGKTATIGFCWGGGQSFAYAAHQPELNAAIVYYGIPPAADDLAKVKAPVLGNYGGKDARVTSTVEPTIAEMKRLNKTYVSHVYEGAGHGFLRAQDLQDGANLKAAQEAWPATIAFLREHTK